MQTTSPTLRVRCSGPLAIFTRPELKTERFSYPVPTPSATRGILEAILWKPAIRWQIQRIHVLAPIQFTSFRRNEVTTKAVAPKAAVVASGGDAPKFFADEDRAQRNTVALQKVDYLIEACLSLTPRAGEGDSITKFFEMFQRRLKKGQCFQQPYFGCRECVADVRPPTGDERSIGDTQDLGLMLWDIDFRQTRGKPDNRPIFYWARLEEGVINIPPTAEAAQASILEFQKKGGA